MAEHHRNLKSAIRGVAFALSCTVAFTFFAALMVPPTPAKAQDAFSCIEELSDDEVRYRIRYIEDKMQDGKTHAARWRYSWMGFWLAAGGVMTWAAVDAGRDGRSWDRFGWAYLAGGSFFFGVMLAAVPAPDVWGPKRIRRQDESTEEARRAKLQYATETLKKASTVQSFNGGAFGVGASLIYGVVGGTIKATQWTGLSRGLTAAMYVAPPLLMGLQTATAPRESVQAYEAYRGIACSSKYYDRGDEGPELDFSLSPAGGSFKVSF